MLQNTQIQAKKTLDGGDFIKELSSLGQFKTHRQLLKNFYVRLGGGGAAAYNERKL